MTAFRAALLVCACALVLTSDATAATSGDFSGHERQVFPVVVVHGLTLGDLPQLATEGAVGLMVPNAGPRTSQVAAFAGMVRGILYNTRLPFPHAVDDVRKLLKSVPQAGALARSRFQCDARFDLRKSSKHAVN